MNKAIILTTLKVICPLVSLYSVFILLRGHNNPGGGFIGGLMLSLSALLWFWSFPESKLRALIDHYFLNILAACLISFLLLLLVPVFSGHEILTGLWSRIPVPIAGKFSSILVFDITIYVLVFTCFTFSFNALAGRGSSR